MAKTSGCGVCWALLGTALVVAGATAYHFLRGGHAHVGSDGRAEIVLSEADRDLVLAEMRMMLAAVQGITTGLSQDDLQLVAQQARSVGLAAMGQVPASLMQALPLEFKQQGRSLHAAFDQIALDAEQLGNREHSLQQLSAVLGQCVACHASFRLTAARDGGK